MNNTVSDNEDDEEDDNHLCLKCKNVINGIDNYVQHRKSKCGSSTGQVSKCMLCNLAAD